jgi:hypothetical protein
LPVKPRLLDLQAQRREPLTRAALRVAARGTAEHQRERHVPHRRRFGQQLPELEDEAEAGTAQLAAVRLAQLVDALAVQQHLAAVRAAWPR